MTRLKERARVIIALREAGLTAVINTLDKCNMCVKVAASKERLLLEAERTAIEMLVDPRYVVERAPVPNVQGAPKLGSFLRSLSTPFGLVYNKLFPLPPEQRYRDFCKADEHEFARKNGHLFSSLERQRLARAVLTA